MYDDNTRKLVVVLNEKQPLPVLFNAAVHCVAGIAGKMGPAELDLLNYLNQPLGLSSWISRYPNIILTARNASQVRRFYEEARDRQLMTNAFIDSMLGSSASVQLEQTSKALPDACQFIAAGAFGSAEELNPLTKRFSLLRDRTAEAKAGDPVAKEGVA